MFWLIIQQCRHVSVVIFVGGITDTNLIEHTLTVILKIFQYIEFNSVKIDNSVCGGVGGWEGGGIKI